MQTWNAFLLSVPITPYRIEADRDSALFGDVNNLPAKPVPDVNEM